MESNPCGENFMESNPCGENFMESNPCGENFLELNPCGENFMESNPCGENFRIKFFILSIVGFIANFSLIKFKDLFNFLASFATPQG